MSWRPTAVNLCALGSRLGLPCWETLLSDCCSALRKWCALSRTSTRAQAVRDEPLPRGWESLVPRKLLVHCGSGCECRRMRLRHERGSFRMSSFESPICMGSVRCHMANLGLVDGCVRMRGESRIRLSGSQSARPMNDYAQSLVRWS